MDELSDQIRAWTDETSLGQEHQLTAEDILERSASGSNLQLQSQQPRRSRGAALAAVAALFVAALGAAGIIYAQTRAQPTGVTAAGRGEVSDSDQGSSGSPEVSAPAVGLDRYNPEALAAASPPDVSTAEIVVVMEARNICQRVHDYSTGAATSAAASDAIDESTAAAAAASTPDQPVDVSQFADFAKTRIAMAETESSTRAADNFIRSECDSSQDYSIRVLAQG